MLESVEEISFMFESILTFMASYPLLLIFVAGVLVFFSATKRVTSRIKTGSWICASIWIIYTICEAIVLIYMHINSISPVRNDVYIFGPVLILVALIGVSLFLFRVFITTSNSVSLGQ